MDRVATPQPEQMPPRRRRRASWPGGRRAVHDAGVGSDGVVGGDIQSVVLISGLLADGRQVVGVGESVLSRGDALGLQILLDLVHLILAVGSAEQYSRPTFLASGIHSTIISACWSSGARSEVPEMLPPTVPEKSVRPRATPYSVTEVPRTGISLVADCAACRAGVAFA